MRPRSSTNSYLPVARPRSCTWLCALPTVTLYTLLLALLLAMPRPAEAAPGNPDDGCLSDPVCRSHYEQAVAAFEQGRFDAALPEFQAAYAQRQMPWLLINMGRTLHRLGRPKDALEQYDLYTKAESRIDPETRQRLDKYIAQAQAQVQSGATPPPGPGPATTPPPDSTPALTTPPPPADKPLYKKWWFWTAIGGGAAVIITGIAIGVAVSNSGASALPGDVMVYRPAF